MSKVTIVVSPSKPIHPMAKRSIQSEIGRFGLEIARASGGEVKSNTIRVRKDFSFSLITSFDEFRHAANFRGAAKFYIENYIENTLLSDFGYEITKTSVV